MTATELITLLQENVRKHGDGPVCLEDWNEAYAKPAEATAMFHDRGIFVLECQPERDGVKLVSQDGALIVKR